MKRREKKALFKCLLQFSGESSYFLILGLSARGQISLSGSINTSGACWQFEWGSEASLSDLENPLGCFRGHVQVLTNSEALLLCSWKVIFAT